MRDKIIECAKKLDADIVGFAPASRFNKNDNIFKIYPDTKTVIGLGFRVLRGLYRGVEEGTTYYQYTTMGVENLEETVMPLAMLRVAQIIEDNDYDAIPQRRHQTIMEDSDKTNPEVDYGDIFRGVSSEYQMDFTNAAVQCGLGELGLNHSILTPEYGPFIRYCFILTDAEFEPTPLAATHLCDDCKECINACPGHAIGNDGNIDSWRCAVYYNGANESKNPFMPPEAYENFEDKKEIKNGTAKIDINKAKEIMDYTYFYPPAKHFYRSSICGRACDRACYIHLEAKGLITKKYNKPFRSGDDWKLSENSK